MVTDLSSGSSHGSSRAVQFTLAYTVCLSAFAIDVSLPAIPDAVVFYGAADQTGQQIVAMYLAGYAVGQIPFGLAADRYGRMRIFYLGIVLFLAATTVTVLAPSMELLLAARFVQGIAGASGPIITRAIARDIAEGRELARLTSLLVSSLAVSTLIAPLLGSGVSYLWGWRATFLVSLVMGALALILMRTFLRETGETNQGAESVWQQFANSARAFRSSPASLWGTALVSFTFFAYLAIVAGLAQIVVDVYEMSSAAVGWVLGSAIFFQVASAQIGRFALHRYSSMKLLQIGFAMYGVAIVLGVAMLLLEQQGFWAFWLTLVIFLTGMGLVFPNATAITLSPLKRSAGFGASILGTIQIACATLGAGLTGLFYGRSITSMLVIMVVGSTLATLTFQLGSRSVPIADD